ncbi:MAG: exosortase/archaeosortase family protein [Desulfobulbaceae bacterium]|nr:exosortase/archaeosortase family protein [Desulfobulbaceae bacterium]
MTVMSRASWFPWLMFIIAFGYSAGRFIILYPSVPGKNDEVLLYVSVLVALWSERKAVSASLLGMDIGSVFFGSALVCSGCFVYAIGRLVQSMTMEVFALFLIPAGLVATLAPSDHLRSGRFIVLAGVVVVIIGWVAPNLLSSELAVAIASVSATVLSATVFPVAANGVLLYFGPYTAEVTPACSGMNSIFALTALSVLYLRIGAQRSLWHIALLIACVIPVAVLTNLGRVILLILATWYVGDDFAQGFFHQAAGIVAFVLAIVLLSVIDSFFFFAYSCIKPPNCAIHADKQV